MRTCDICTMRTSF